MFITKKHISRRTVLKGAGVNLALPFLSAMVPASTALAQTAANPKLRAGFFYIPHGAIMFNTKYGPEWDRWTPSGSGADYKLNEINSPMEPFKKQMTTFGNLENAAAAGSVHVRNPATWLSATLPYWQQHVHDARPGDDEVHQPGHAVSLAGTLIGDHGAGGGRQRRALYNAIVPRRAYAAADGIQPAQGLPAVVRRRRQSAGARRHGPPEGQHSGHDRRPRQHIEGRPGQRGQGHSRWVSGERARGRTAVPRRAANPNLSKIQIPNAPIGELEDFAEQEKIMYDLLALAYQADLTRVATYITVAEGTNRSYPFLNISDGFHPISHHADDLERIKKLVQIQKWHMQTVRRVPQEDGGHAGRTGFAAGPLDLHVRIEHEQQQPAQQLPDSEPDRRRRQRQAEAGRPAPGAAGAHAHREPASDAAAEGGA